MKLFRKKQLINKLGLNLFLFSNNKKNIIKYSLNNKLNDYINQIREIQKIRVIYGASIYRIKKFINLIKYTNKNILYYFNKFIAFSIDYILFKSGFFLTRLSSKQYISHGLLLLNCVRITIPSILIKDNDRLLFTTNISCLNIKYFSYDNYTGEYIFLSKLFNINISNINIYIILSIYRN